MPKPRQIMHLRRRRDPHRLRERAEQLAINRIEPPLRELAMSYPDADDSHADRRLKSPLAEKLTDALERRQEQRDADIRCQLVRLDRLTKGLLRLLEQVAAELQGEAWEVTLHSQVGKRPNPSQTIFKGRLIRRNKRGQPFAYRSEIENRMSPEMLEFVSGFWFTWRGKQAIDVELVRRIATRRTWSLIEQLS